MEYQTQFFGDGVKCAGQVLEKRGGDKKRKVEKCPLAVTWLREAAHMHIKAIDKQLQLTTGEGLVQFAGGDSEPKDVAKQFLEHDVIPPTLCLHLDQGSPAYSMTWFLMSHVGLRMLSIFDPHHRAWNDIKMGVGKRLWYVVLLMVVVFNLPFGPWEGGAWYEKLLVMSEELAKSLSIANPLFIARYELLCIDLGLEASGDAVHRQIVFDMIFSSGAFRTRGEKVSLRRWFGWLSSAHKFLPHWHSRLMGIVACGQVQGVYKSYRDVPLWAPAVKPSPEALDADPPQDIIDAQEQADTQAADNGRNRARAQNSDQAQGSGPSSAAQSLPAVAAADKRDHDHGIQEQHKAAAQDNAAAAAAAAAVRDCAPEPSDDKGRVNEPTGAEQLKDLWKQHRRHVFVAGCILSQDGMRNNVAMILEVCRAVWTQHSSDAHTLRSPADTFKYYLSAAKEEYLSVFESSATVLLNLAKLSSMGFVTDFGSGLPAGATVTSDIVQSQSAHAYTLVELWSNTTYHRLTSMMWHSHSWFGLLALLGSDVEEDYTRGVFMFQCDYAACEASLEKQRGSSFIGKLNKSSVFRYRMIKEIACILTLETGLPIPDVRAKVRHYIQLVFTGWGQTKICEDTFKELRYREKLDTLNLRRSPTAIYAAMHDMGTIGLHKRNDIEIPEMQPAAEGNHKTTFSCSGHEPSIANHRDITQYARWQTFSPQSSKRIYADQMLINHLHATDTWEHASKAWQCELLQQASIIQRVSDKEFFFVMGHLAHLVTIAWKVETVNLPRTNHQVFLIGGQVVVNTKATVLAVLNVDDFVVIPTVPISPIHYFIACNKKLPKNNGVVLMQYKPSRHIMLHAAYNAFWDLQLPQLAKIVKEYNIQIDAAVLAPTLTAVLRFMIKKHTGTDATDTELQDILALRCAEIAEPLEFIGDEDMLIEFLGEDDRQAYEDKKASYA